MRCMLLFFIAFLLPCFISIAQEQPISTSQPMQDGHALIPTEIPTSSSSHRLAVLRLMDMLYIKSLLSERLETLLKSQIQQMPQLAPFEDILRRFFQKHMSWETIKKETIQLYMESFSEEEIEQIIAFYQTEIGKKMARSMPGLISKGLSMGHQRIQKHIDELQSDIQKRMEELKESETATK